MAFLSRKNQPAAVEPDSLPLPAPDRFGNYWAAQRPHGPAVFVSGSGARPVRPGKFFASTGRECGVLTEAGGIRYFDTAREAWEVLTASLRNS